ncbi:MAG TPA: hypothetical protein VIF62_24015 [Labilithrix sp.]|jgi:hypothetical protein
MSTYYEFAGSLTFGSKKDAADACAQLRALDFFWTPEPKTAKDLVVEDATLTFASEGFGGDYETFIDARILLGELVKTARSGRVRVQAGDGGPGTEVDFFGFKPAPAKKAPAKNAPAKKAPAKKGAAEKATTKKRAANKRR